MIQITVDKTLGRACWQKGASADEKLVGELLLRVLPGVSGPALPPVPSAPTYGGSPHLAMDTLAFG